jgi:predicted nucleotidyltransferase
VQNKESQVKPYSKEELQKLFQFRLQDTQTSFEDFVKTESRKALQGKFKGRDYFMRFVKDSSEIQEDYGAVQYKNMGYAEVKAEVEDDSEAIFTPCNYKIRKVKVLEGARSNLIDEIASFRGRFCEQAKKGEVIIARGKVEHVSDCKQNREHFRLLLGNKPSDFMVLA